MLCHVPFVDEHYESLAVLLDDGEDVYKVLILPTDVENFNKYGAFIYKKKSELTDEELSRAIPIILMAGSPTGGKIITNAKGANALFAQMEESWI